MDYIKNIIQTYRLSTQCLIPAAGCYVQISKTSGIDRLAFLALSKNMTCSGAVCVNLQTFTDIHLVYKQIDIYVSNSLDPDETPSFSASHLNQNCLQTEPLRHRLKKYDRLSTSKKTLDRASKAFKKQAIIFLLRSDKTF